MKLLGLCRISSDIELKQMNSTTVVVNFSIAYNIFSGKNPDGTNKMKSVFFDCSAWGQRAIYIKENLHKGDEVFIEATPDLEKWEDKNTNKRTKHSLIIDSITATRGKKFEPLAP